MSKIIAREKDLTSAGTQQYSNFSVLVPGFIAEDKQAAYDAASRELGLDGALEVNTLSDFKKYIGHVLKIKEISAAEAPIFSEVSGENGIIYTDATKNDIESWFLNKYNVYEIIEDQSIIEAGRLKVVGKSYKLIDTIDKLAVNKAYTIIEAGNEGKDAVKLTHYGNQIACELINLGYTVLYKQINSISELDKPDFWKQFKDKSLYDFRYVVTGLINNNDEANKQILNLCKFDKNNDEFVDIDIDSTGRGDCIALIDANEDLYTQGISQYDAVAALLKKYTEYGVDGKYAAITTPSVLFKNLPNNKDYNGNNLLPATFYYLACAAKAFENYPEYFAVSGYERGVCNLAVADTTVHFGDYAVNILQKRVRTEAVCCINPVIKLRKNFYLWGNRTAFYDSSKSNIGLVASDFLNIRQLCTSIKKQVYVACRRFTFDQNSDILWVNFKNQLTPTLDAMVANQGITDYAIVKIATSEKAMLKARIRIVPIEAVEDFDICLTLEDSISGTVVSFDD